MCNMPNTREKEMGSRSDAISPAWPEDTAEKNNDNSTELQKCCCPFSNNSRSCLRSTYNNWTYSYMNSLFTKGAKQRKDTSTSSQLTLHDLFTVPKMNDATLLNAKFWTLFNERIEHNFFQTLWLLVKPTFVPDILGSGNVFILQSFCH